MAENTKKTAATLIKYILGIALILLGVSAIIGWWGSLVEVFKGCIGLFLVLAGLITFAIAKE
ncbi:MAG: hypothetical protein ABH954_04000 [Candidatus Omnitrophota bacterium]